MAHESNSDSLVNSLIAHDSTTMDSTGFSSTLQGCPAHKRMWKIDIQSFFRVASLGLVLIDLFASSQVPFDQYIFYVRI